MRDDIALSLETTDLTRRHFLMTSLSAGFALVVQPVTAATITTDTTGLVAGEVKIPVKDGEIPGYRAMPDKAGPFPVVLVFQEIFGVHEHIKDVCRRLAKAGYMAIAPELFARQGDVSKLTDFQEIFSKVVSKVPDEQVMADLDAAVEYARKSGKGDADRLATTGFCWGGRVVWLYAAHNPKVKAGVAWYGRLAPRPNVPSSPLQPTHPVDVAARITVPVLGLYGGKDEGIPLSNVEEMRTKLKQGKSASEIVIYPEAPHGFHADYRPSFHKASAADGWKRMLAWFKQHGAV